MSFSSSRALLGGGCSWESGGALEFVALEVETDTDPIDKQDDEKSIPEKVVTPPTPEVKADTVDLESTKDQSIGTSDLKKL